jgi:hypothetical protein
VKDAPRQGTPWLEVLKNMDTGAISEAENGLDVASSSENDFSESLNQQGAKSARSLSNTLLALLAPRRLAHLEKYTPCTILLDATRRTRSSPSPCVRRGY